MEEEDEGPGRRVHNTVCFGTNPSKRHEHFAIATTEDELLHDICDYVAVAFRKDIKTYSIHPHGIGICEFVHPWDPDILVRSSPHQIGPHIVSFVKHDEALNCRRSPFTRTSWVMLLGYPLDYKEHHFLQQECTPFGKLIHWHAMDHSWPRILIKVLIDDILEVPRSLKLKSGRFLDREGCSWTIHVYILNVLHVD